MFDKKPPQKIKNWQWIVILAIIVISLGGQLYSFYWPKAQLRIGGHEIKVILADTAEHRVKGLSGKKNMGPYGGMLFVFADKGQHTMVMRDMNFPLDIIWIDGNEIVDMASDLQPEPGRAEAQLTPYFARLPSNLVLELPAGFIKKNGLKIGDVVEILQ